MPSLRAVLVALTILAMLTLAAAGCGDDDDSGDGGEQAVDVSLSEDCTPGQLETLEENTLTVATDSPAFPPYFVGDDPTNGKGFESAVAYEIAATLGYSEDEVEWVVEPFNRSYAPGPKDFDFDVNQISITPKREQQVDFSVPYYEAEQAVVVLKGSDYEDASSLADLTGATIGVQIGTTSLDAVESEIGPETEPKVFDTSNDVVTALEQEQVDAVVVDVPTAFYLTAVQVPKGVTVGQFPAPGGDTWGALLEKGSPLTDCVSAAIGELESSGKLAEIEQRWMAEVTKAPVLD